MEKLFILLKEILASGRDAVVVSVAASSGSTPRGTGAKMLVSEKGREFGTIGGGSVEYEAEKLAANFLKEKIGGMRDFKLAPNQIQDLGMVCGGDVTVYFQYVSAENHDTTAMIDEILVRLKSNETNWLITDITPETGGKMGVYGKKGGFAGIDNQELFRYMTNKAQRCVLGRCEYIVEQLVDAGAVYVFGGGHVSREFVPMAHKVGFRCVVLDDREEFASRKFFPDAMECILVDFENIGKYVEMTENDYVVIMTRGHKCDAEVEAFALKTRATYIGIMGSRSKKAYVEDKMRGLGFTDSDLKRVKTPIGIQIGAETPEEIAVSIVAELIKVRAARKED